MRSVTFILIGAGVTGLLMATAGLVYLRATGLDALAQPGTLEARLARAASMTPTSGGRAPITSSTRR